MKNYIIPVLVVFIIPKGFSQQEEKFLKGIVVNDSIHVENITITNKNLKLSTGTNEFGVFEIPVRLGDSLLISAIHIKNVSLFINQETLKKRGIEVPVLSKVNQMDAVVLNNILSSNALDFSAALKPSYKPDLESMRRMEVTRMANTDPTAIFGSGGGGGGVGSGAFNITKPLFILIDKIVKRLKKNSSSKPDKDKKLSTPEKLKKLERFKTDFINQYGVSFFTQDLKIPKLVIDEFLLYCKKEKDISSMYYNHQELELIDFFVKKSQTYREFYGME